MDYTIGIKHPYKGHHYALQNVLILQAVQMTLFTMENSSPNSGQTHDHCVCRWTYTAGCIALPEVCKLTQAHHLLS